ENEVRAGKLVDAARVERVWSTILTRVKDGVLGVPTKLRGRVHDVSPGALTVLDTLLREVLEELAGPADGDNGTATNGRAPTRARRRARVRPGKGGSNRPTPEGPHGAA